MEQELQQLQSYYQIIIDFLLRYSVSLVAAVLLLLVGLWVANRCGRWLFTLLEGKGIDVTLANFVANVVKVMLIATTVVICLGKLGISITPFVAAIGAASLGAGLAIQGTLSNYGAGLAIILTRPFVLTNTLSVKGYTGIVEEINLSTTVLRSEDGEQITIPNRHIVGEILKNTQQRSLVEGEVGVSYSADPEQAIALLTDTLQALDSVQSEPALKVGIASFGDSGVNIAYRVWVPSLQLHQSRFTANLAVYQALREADIAIPFPQREVRIMEDRD